ncbi:UNVERIFIED_CONTAM: hypothetical protein PYX00_003341 [Menopon gallinae]|uniref:Histone-lysine N-methyltransferase trithorax n=1 Tax=Menopon gallinae TaxID=328185 RepID=A0AAW2I1Y9_9NEOP
MGRSKFPGKPSKIGNRKRVNLSSCALPEENESSKAAENIYLGLSMFNEAFGDNEMVPPSPFHGFSPQDVEDALAVARLQQRESEIEYKKQGITVNMQDSFQSELSSIKGKFNLIENHDKNKTRLCFDGGGSRTVEESADVVKTNYSKPSSTNKMISNLTDNNDKVNDLKNKSKCTSKDKIMCKTIRIANTKRNIFKLKRKTDKFKSLQSRAAKKLLQKAKMSNLSEVIKSNTSERKFVLPTYSMRSLRVIKPNKKFIEDSEIRKERLLQARYRSNTSQLASRKLFTSMHPKISAGVSLCKELRVEITDNIGKKGVKEDSDGKNVISQQDLSDNLKSCSSDSAKPSVPYSSTGKLILREPKLQLNRINLGLTEGPFSSSSHSSSLSPNSHINPNPTQISTSNKSVSCGVCGSVRFYKFVGLGKKFGVYCCEPCQKFISKIIQSVGSEKNCRLQCLKGKGVCLVPPIMKNTAFRMECQACWLKLCLKSMKVPIKLRNQLLELLPVDVQKNLSTEPSSKSDIGFGISNNSVKDFRWLKEEDVKYDCGKATRRCKTLDKSVEKKEIEPTATSREISLRKGNVSARLENKRKLLRQKGRIKTFADGGSRQSIMLKGPRVKNVCRSASIVLGQPIATFPPEPSPKKQSNDSATEIKHCDKSETTNVICAETQEVLSAVKSKESLPERKQPNPKSSISAKQVVNNKPSPTQQSSIGRTKRKGNLKTENPISIDFWETYDPEEICETGFGLIGSENFSVRALCFLCGSSGQEKLIHCASCCEPYHEFCVNEELVKVHDDVWKYDWVCPRCTVCVTCGKTSDRVGGRLLHSPDRPWVCSVCLRCKSCNGVDVSVFVGNLPLCRACFVLRQKGNYCPLCQRCYEDDDYDSKMMECGQCKCWVHAKCEGLSDEKYQVLSFLPESVEYICRVCCVMPPAPWWLAVEAELKSGYLGVLKALSKNRKACAMLKWSPRKQCTCRQVNFTPRALDFDESKPVRSTNESCKGENVKKPDQDSSQGEENSKAENVKPAPVVERKTSIEVINHASEGSLKLTLKILKGPDNNGRSDSEDHQESEGENCGKIKDMYEKFNIKQCSVRVKKCPLNEEADSLANSVDGMEDSQDRNVDYSTSSVELPDKRPLSSPLNPSSDSGIGSTDDELKANSLTDEESCKLDEQQSNRFMDLKIMNEPSVPFLEEKNECICFLEVDSYNSRSKPFSPSLLSIKKKVTTSEYSSLQQFHMDMQRMIATTQSAELMEMYHQTVKEIFPWFDPKFSRVHTGSQKISGASVESTPVKNSPTKSIVTEDCKVPKELLTGQALEYYYSGYSTEDNRSCLMCKGVGDGPPNETGRLLYCGQNEWVHCNCALWSAEVFEEIDGSLQNVHSAINRGRSIRCPECNLKGASIGCCARNCADTFHFKCARKVGCAFMDDKTVYCPAHLNETKGKLLQNENEFEIRRPVYVELDKRKMKSVDSSQVRFAVGGLHVENLGRFVVKLSDQPEAIIPEQFQCTRLFWSCYEPWKIVKYHFTVRLQEDEQNEGVDFGINLTVDHSKPQDVLELKLKQLKYFQEHHRLLEIGEPSTENSVKEKRKLNEKPDSTTKLRSDDLKQMPAKRPKKESKIVKKIVDLFDPREDESCLSDSQNTADLIPPELEEAIFKDLPNDILDGISMQDIFMDIKSDIYENGEKEGRDMDDSLEVEDVMSTEQPKTKKYDANSETQNESWSDDSKQNVYEWTDEVDGGVDSSSSGSEAGESPQRLTEENVISTRGLPPPQASSYSLNAPYSEGNTQSASAPQPEYPFFGTSFNVPQIDGMDDSSSDDSDYENFKPVKVRNTQCISMKVTQLDGSADSENELKINHDDLSRDNAEEPVKCNQCRCTYRTKVSYERHLENCCNDYMLFSSDGEGSEEESPFHQGKTESEQKPPVITEPKETPKTEVSSEKPTNVPQKPAVEPAVQKEKVPVKPEVKNEKIKKPQVRKKPVQTPKKPPLMANSQQVQQILVHQNTMPPAVLVQDIAHPNIVPAPYLDTSTAIQYVASLESQNAFTKPQLIATPGAVIPSSFHIQTPESQLIPSLPVLPQNVQTNLPGIIIQQPQVAGTLISPQPTPVVMSGDQMVLGTAPLLEVIHDPQTGGMFLASHNQPLFYNMETIVSNTVMQTNQYVSNVMTASSFSQTSTQVVQTSKLEQVMNVPSNFILVGQNSDNKIITSSDLICLPTPQPLIQNQPSVQTVMNPLLQASQAFNTQPKIVLAPVNANIRCIQPMQAKTTACPPSVLNKVPVTQTVNRAPDVTTRVTTYTKNVVQSKQNNFRSMPMMRPNVTKSPPRQYEKAVIVPKSTQKPGTRAIVDYINNFKSETCDTSPPVVKEVESVKEAVPKRVEESAVPAETTQKPKELPPVVNVPMSLPIIEPEKQDEPAVEECKPPTPAKEDENTATTTESMDVDVKVEPAVEKEDVMESVPCEPAPEPEEPEKPEEEEEQQPENKKETEVPQEPVKKVEDVEAPKIEPPTATTLPLQETSPSANNTPAVQKTPISKTETLKEKTKMFNSNQNCVATKLVTIHPRLIQDFEAESENKKKFPLSGKSDDKGPKLIFDVTSDDGFKSSSSSMAELWAKICDSVQEMRAVFKIPPLPISRKGHEVLGMQNHGLQHCLEQLRGVEQCVKYKCKYFVKEKNQKPDDRLTPIKENLSGCARTETYSDRKEYDMFAWLASRHRRLPKLCETSEEVLSSARRANSLPMAMRYRHLRETAKTYVGVYRSKIHGKGLFCLREIEAGEMVIEYAGEVIRSNITDKREKYYTEKGIGCYMFRIDDHFVVDATMKGNAARFINHSCEPNCYSRVVDILGKKHIVIFALRRIHVMEELTYDYKFPFEDEKISCHCLSKKCRKYLN